MEKTPSLAHELFISKGGGGPNLKNMEYVCVLLSDGCTACLMALASCAFSFLYMALSLNKAVGMVVNS